MIALLDKAESTHFFFFFVPVGFFLDFGVILLRDIGGGAAPDSDRVLVEVDRVLVECSCYR